VKIQMYGPTGWEVGFPGFSNADRNGRITTTLGVWNGVNTAGTWRVEFGYGRNLSEVVASVSFTVEPLEPQCFTETGKCMRGRFLAYWYEHGGLEFNGYPISDEFVETLEDGNAYTVQYFERVRMEYHPENAGTRYEGLLGQFGRRIHPVDPPVAPLADASYFPQTGHNVRGGFRAFYVGATAEGGADFGYPISEEFIEVLEDGRPYLVQYFERARFEWHPENPPAYQLLLGQFGRRILGNR
jgi:hypothetical protein